jgi:hypothetical protein
LVTKGGLKFEAFPLPSSSLSSSSLCAICTLTRQRVTTYVCKFLSFAFASL